LQESELILLRSDDLYWVWLQLALGVSSSLRTQEIVDAFGEEGARGVYHASEFERRVAGVFTNLQLKKLQEANLRQAENVLEECERLGLHILTPRGQEYPPRLLEIPNYPLALYAHGDMGEINQRLCLSIVGTRRADRKSVDIAGRLSADLVRAGCAIISGCALGIDSAAHWGALHAGGRTLAVLGCGYAADYLPENTALREKIAQNGAVITEYAGAAAPMARNFPIRNRIISGISVGTIVVEAGERSGSLITATCAAEQGRDVFAVPGDAFGSTYTGGNKLIREGAKPVFSAVDVLEEYEMIYPGLLNMRRARRDLERAAIAPERVVVQSAPKRRAASAAAPPAPGKPTRPLNEAEEKIARALRAGPLHIDAIAKQTGLPFGALFAALTTLEIDGIAAQMPGKLYELKPT
jgi:DNA processing protein